MAAVLAEPAAVFTFSNYLDPKRFAIAAGIRIGLFIVSIVIFPPLLWGIANASGCRGVGGACGALGLVVAMAYKPLVAVAFIFSFAGISVRRARDAGVPGWVGLFVPLLRGRSCRTDGLRRAMVARVQSRGPPHRRAPVHDHGAVVHRRDVPPAVTRR